MDEWAKIREKIHHIEADFFPVAEERQEESLSQWRGHLPPLRTEIDPILREKLSTMEEKVLEGSHSLREVNLSLAELLRHFDSAKQFWEDSSNLRKKNFELEEKLSTEFKKNAALEEENHSLCDQLEQTKLQFNVAEVSKGELERERERLSEELTLLRKKIHEAESTLRLTQEEFESFRNTSLRNLSQAEKDLDTQKTALEELKKTSQAQQHTEKALHSFSEHNRKTAFAHFNAILKGMREHIETSLAIVGGLRGDWEKNPDRKSISEEDLTLAAKYLKKISTCLDNASAWQEKADFHPELSRIEPLIEIIFTELSQPAQEKHIDLFMQGASALPELYFDRKGMLETLRNVILNAVEFADPNTRVAVLCQMRQDMPVAEIRVYNRGIFPSKDVLDRMYEPYFTTVKSKSGMGLTQARYWVLLHGGQISCSKNDKNQTEFLIQLPTPKIQ